MGCKTPADKKLKKKKYYYYYEKGKEKVEE